MPFAVGDLVAGRYEVQASLGQRPLGWLYRAREREIGVEVALRVIGPSVLPDEGARIAFTQRLTRARAFSHPSLVRVFGVYPQREEVVVAVQWAPGSTLADRVRERHFTMEEARPLVTQVAAGMTHAHQHGVILGDVHAQTVVLLGSNIKLSNVGIGPSLPRKRFLEAVRDTPGFSQLAPEIRNGLPADTRADVFSLGMLLVEMLTGGDNREAVQGPAPLQAVLGRALADDPLLRHTSIEALSQELEAVLSGQTPRPPRRPTPPLGSAAVPPPSLKEDKEKPPLPSEKTRSMSDDELALLKGDQITRQVPQEEIFPLRVQSSDTHEVDLSEMGMSDDDLPTRTGDDLALERSIEAQPAAPHESGEQHEIETTEVPTLEHDALRTEQVPRLEQEDVDTHRVEKARLDELIEGELPPTSVAVPKLPRPPSLPGLADAPDAPTSIDLQSQLPRSEPPTGRPDFDAIEADDAATSDKPPTVDARPKARSDGKLRQPNAPEKPQPAAPSKPQPAAPSKPQASAPPKPPAPEKPQPIPLDKLQPPAPPAPIESAARRTLPVDEEAPTNTATPLPPPAPASSLPPMGPPIMPEAGPPPGASRRKRRNPFEPLPPDAGSDEKITGERAPARTANGSAPPRKRRNPFETPAGDGPPSAGPPPATAASKPAGRASKRRPPPPKPTQHVLPIGHSRRWPVVVVLGSALVLGAVLTAMYMSRRVQEERIENERLSKQRLAEELQKRAEQIRKMTPAPDAGVLPQVKPLVTPAEAPITVLPRSGPCPLGAHLVSTGGKGFCIDVYEYPGGNTMPRTSVSLSEAAHICSQRGERLCNDTEWERACRGKGNSSYPYGQTFDPTRCNTKGNSGDIAPSGTFASCKSASGAYDMSGNVAEWVASGDQRGGSAQQGARESRCSAIVRNAPRDGSVLVGFRCCADPTPPARH